MTINFFPAITAVNHSHSPPPSYDPLPFPSSSSLSPSSSSLHSALGMSATAPAGAATSYAYPVSPLSSLLSILQHGLPASSPHPSFSPSSASAASPMSALSSPSPSSALPASASSPSSRLTSSHVLQQLLAGGVAGAVARTVVAPLDRVKMLMQTQHLLHKNHTAPTAAFSSPAPNLPPVRSHGLSLSLPSFRASPTDKYSTLVSSLQVIYREEGLRQLWKGNALNVARVIPYSAIQFGSYDAYKHAMLNDQPRRLTARERLEAGALAGMTATTVTHPMDVVRLRLSVDKSLHGTRDALREVWLEGGMRALFKGYVPTMLSVSPFIALNFASFDLLKQRFPTADSPLAALSPTLHTLSLGAAAGLFAQSVCYPLDTVRRRQQIKGKHYNGTVDAVIRIGRGEGVRGYYRGMVPNAVKVVPSNAIRFVVYEAIKRHLSLDNGQAGGSSSM